MTKRVLTTKQWLHEARKWATIANQEWFRDHINVLDLTTTVGVQAIFGNNRYRQDERTRSQVEILRERMKAAGIEELAFGLSKAARGYPHDAGYTWCIILDTDEDALVEGLKREVWAMYRGFQKERHAEPADDGIR